MHISDEAFSSGLQLNRLKNIFDVLDSVSYFRGLGLSSKFAGIGSGSLGALTLASALIINPKLFDATVLHVTKSIGGLFQVIIPLIPLLFPAISRSPGHHSSRGLHPLTDKSILLLFSLI